MPHLAQASACAIITLNLLPSKQLVSHFINYYKCPSTSDKKPSMIIRMYLS